MPPSASVTIFALPGTLRLGSREFVIPAPTATDVARVREKMRELAGKFCVNPLSFVSASRELVDEITFVESIRIAVAIGSGGGAEPTVAAIMRTYETLEGVRWRVWYAARRADPVLTQETVAALVTEENYYEASEALHKAMGLDTLEKKAPQSGAN